MSQNKWFIWVSILIILAAAVGGGLYFWQKYNSDFISKINQPIANQNQDSNLPLANQNTNQSVDDLIDWQTYKNSQYGFELTFPNTWRGYKATNKILDWGIDGTSDSIGFGFEGSLFNISMHTKNNWQKIKSEEGPTPTFLGEKDEFVFAYSVGHDLASEYINTNRNEILSIIKTFKFIQ
ncbi:MAG TPA: hypothetical protein VJG65_00100 [Patescibacteria group bacterium]|nr:hypothetical protein [Patescibacteria group bacterium]